MKVKFPVSRGGSGKSGKRQQYPNTQAPSESELPDSGSTRSGSAGRAIFGPYTNR